MLLQKFIDDIHKENLISANDRLLLGVSGGSDSIAMLHLFLKAQKEINFTFGIAHLNHGLRGKKALRDENFVAKSAKIFDIPYFSKKTDVLKLSKTNKLSLEDAARRARYDFFQETAEQNGYNKLALAHTLDDQAETIFMKFLRGTGLRGLTGMQRSRALTNNILIIRPLLNFSKQDLVSYCKKNKLAWKEDHTNKNIDFTRNKIRKTLMPQIKDINPNLNQTLDKMSKVLAEENKYIEDRAGKLLKQVTQKQIDTGIRLDTQQLSTLPKAIQRRIIRLAMEQVQGDLQDIYLPFIENFLDNKLTTIVFNTKGKLEVSKKRL